MPRRGPKLSVGLFANFRNPQEYEDYLIDPEKVFQGMTTIGAIRYSSRMDNFRALFPIEYFQEFSEITKRAVETRKNRIPPESFRMLPPGYEGQIEYSLFSLNVTWAEILASLKGYRNFTWTVLKNDELLSAGKGKEIERERQSHFIEAWRKGQIYTRTHARARQIEEEIGQIEYIPIPLSEILKALEIADSE